MAGIYTRILPVILCTNGSTTVCGGGDTCGRPVVAFKGDTHGCGCCSDTEDVSLRRIREHITDLEGALKEAREVEQKLISLGNEDASR